MLRSTSNIIGQMTLDCNLRCKYCYEGHNKSRGKQFTFEQFKEALDTVLYHRCILGRMENRVEWHFHGGEVTLIPWETLKKMIEYVEERHKIFPGLTWGIQTNGTLLNEEMCQYFTRKGVTVGLSFDGFDVEDRMSKEENRKFIERLRSFHQDFGTKMSFLMVFSRKNMKSWAKDACELMSFAEMVGVNLLCAGKDNKEDVPNGEEIWEYWFRPVLESYLTDTPIVERDVQIAIAKIICQLAFNTSQERLFKSGCFDRVCGIYTNMTSINPDMKLHPCDKFMESGDFLNKRVGWDLHDRDFLGLQQAKLAVKHYDKMFKLEKRSGCDQCPARWACPGDCQSYNISMTGEVSLNEDYCKAYRRLYDFVEEHIIELMSRYRWRVELIPDNLNPWFMKRVDEAGKRLDFDIKNGSVKLEDK